MSDNLVLNHMEKVMKEKNDEERKYNISNSYGAVMLNTGEVIAIKRHFFTLKELWRVYIENPKHEIFKLGYFFETEELLLHLKDIKLIINTQSYDNYIDNLSSEEQVNNIFKVNMISNQVLEMFPNKYLEYNKDIISEEDLGDFYDDEDEEEELN